MVDLIHDKALVQHPCHSTRWESGYMLSALDLAVTPFEAGAGDLGVTVSLSKHGVIRFRYGFGGAWHSDRCRRS